MRAFPANKREEEVLAEFVRTVQDATIGFLKLSVENGVEDAEPAGTGTLAKIGDTYGVLTAAHVVSEWPKSGKVGIVRFQSDPWQLQRQSFDVEGIRSVCIGVPPFDELGPDLAFVQLPPQTVDWLLATNVFENLDNAKPEGVWKAFDSVVGVVAELTKPVPSPMSNSHAKKVTAYLLAGSIDAERMDAGFDVLEFLPSFGDAILPPESYEGTSGGGLWRLLIDPKDSRTPRRYFYGIAFYQTDAIDGHRKLLCNGPKAIYDHLLPKVREHIVGSE